MRFLDLKNSTVNSRENSYMAPPGCREFRFRVKTLGGGRLPFQKLKAQSPSTLWPKGGVLRDFCLTIGVQQTHAGGDSDAQTSMCEFPFLLFFG